MTIDEALAALHRARAALGGKAQLKMCEEETGEIVETACFVFDYDTKAPGCSVVLVTPYTMGEMSGKPV